MSQVADRKQKINGLDIPAFEVSVVENAEQQIIDSVNLAQELPVAVVAPTIKSIKEAYDNTIQFILETSSSEEQTDERLRRLSMPLSHFYCHFCGVLDVNRKPVIQAWVPSNGEQEIAPSLDWLPDDCEVVMESEFDVENVISLRVLLPEHLHTRVSLVRMEHMTDTPFKIFTEDGKMFVNEGMRPTWPTTTKKFSSLGGWLPKSVVDEEYRVLHFNVYPNLLLESWDVGRDMRSKPIEKVGDEWVRFCRTETIKIKPLQATTKA